jgi:hypothetical protein
MGQRHRRRGRVAWGCVAALSASLAQAGEPPVTASGDTDGAQRYTLQTFALQPSAHRDRVDGRFQVQARLAPEPAAGQYAGGIELRATLLPKAAAAACSGGSSVFYDGFE